MREYARMLMKRLVFCSCSLSSLKSFWHHPRLLHQSTSHSGLGSQHAPETSSAAGIRALWFQAELENRPH
eukprot:6090019-Amphidinium_carterae.1